MSCAHHWLIEEPNGPVVAGICRECGDVRAWSTTSADGGPLSVKDMRRGRYVRAALPRPDGAKVRELRRRFKVRA